MGRQIIDIWCKDTANIGQVVSSISRYSGAIAVLLIGNGFLTIVYDKKYVMVDEHFEQYYPMTELEIHGCK